MGAEGSKQELESNPDLFFIKAEKDARFGQVDVYKSKSTGQLLWVKTNTGDQTMDLTAYKLHIKNNQAYMGLFNTIDVRNKVAKHLKTFICSQDQMVTQVYLERIEKTLLDDLLQRAKSQKRFGESEIYTVMDKVLQMELFMQFYKRLNGDLRLSSIFVTEDGYLKFYDPVLLEQYSNGYYSALFGEEQALVSPEEMLDVRRQSNKSLSVEDYTEAWSLGIILLCLCNLKTEESIYDWKTKNIRFEAIEVMLGFTRRGYSPELSNLITAMLERDTQRRISISSLISHRQQYLN